MSMPVFKRLFAVVTAMAAAAVVFMTPTASAATPAPKDATALVKDLAAGDVSAATAYTFTNVKSGWCLNQDYSGGTAHHDVLAWACDSSARNEDWYMTQDPDTGWYVIENADSGQCLNQDYSGGTAHHDVLAWPCDSSARNEYWDIQLNSNRGALAIQNAASGWYLNQDYSGGVAHHDVLAWNDAGTSDNELWK